MARTGRPPLLEPTAVLAVHHLPIPQQALELGVSTGTVKRQWKRLRDEGLISLGDARLPRRGGAARGRSCQQAAVLPGQHHKSEHEGHEPAEQANRCDND